MRSDEIIRLLSLAADYRDPNPDRCHITGQEHALRCASLNRRFGQEGMLVGLVHDLARPFSDAHHGEVMASMCSGVVSPESLFVLRTHGAYQAALLHNRPTGFIEDGWDRRARLFADLEVVSFQFNVRAMDLDRAHELIRAFFLA